MHAFACTLEIFQMKFHEHGKMFHRVENLCQSFQKVVVQVVRTWGQWQAY